MFISSTYTAIIANPDSDFLINTHEHKWSFFYPSLIKYSLIRDYYMRPDYFKPYNDLCNFIEYKLQGVYASSIFNPSGIFI